jgi:glycosyltransferase involved in cell wall biosynthesis
MKIAIIADALDYQYAGIYYYTKELINAIAKIDKKNEYWIVRSKSSGDISPNVKELIIPIKKFPGAAAFRLFVSIPQILAKKGVDIVVEPRHFGPFNLPKHIKRVTVIHDLSPIHFPQWHQFTSRFLQQLFLPSILKRADYIITNSEFTAQDVIQHFPFTKNKISGVLLGKEPSFTPQLNKSVLNKYHLKKPYLLHTGTIEPRKNLNLLLKAFEQIKKEATTDLQLVLVGKPGWKSQAFFEAIKQSPFRKDIKLLGYVEREELPALYSQALAFVYPSHFEGFGLPVLEAMACGTPVLVSDNSSLPEISGKAGLLFESNNQNDLVEQLHKIINSSALRTSLATKSLQQATLFSWENTAKKTIAIFENLT